MDVAEVPSVPSSQQALCVMSCFDQFPGSFGDCTPSSLVTPPSGLSFLLVTLEDPGLLVSELLDKIAGLSALPSSAFYLTFGHTRLNESGTLKSAGLQRDALLRMRGRLPCRHITRTPQPPSPWFMALFGVQHGWVLPWTRPLLPVLDSSVC